MISLQHSAALLICYVEMQVKIELSDNNSAVLENEIGCEIAGAVVGTQLVEL